MKNILFLFLLSFAANAQKITTVAGNGVLGYSGDNDSAILAKLHLPGNVIVDNTGNLFIADTWGHRIRKVDLSTNIITTIAGTGMAGYNGDGILATSAQLNDPVGLALDGMGNLYVGDALNYRIRKVDFATGIISTVAGNGLSGFDGDNGPAILAKLKPGYIAFDSQGNLFISESTHRIRKIDGTSNVITTICGNGAMGFNGDNINATVASLNFPQGIAFDAVDNLYVADGNNNRIRRIDKNTGVITTICGDGTVGYNGDGIPANTSYTNGPIGITFDKSDNLFFSEFPGNRIRKISASGIIYDVAGTGVGGFNGDGILSDTAQLNEPTGLGFDSCQNLYIADAANERIRKIIFFADCETEDTITNLANLNLIDIICYPNPTYAQLHVNNLLGHTSYFLLNLVGSIIKEGVMKKGNNDVDMTAIPSGVYYLKLTTGKRMNETRKIVKQ